MANLLAHRVRGVREAIEKVGAPLLFLQPHMPDFNPFEMAFSNVANFISR